MNELSESFRHQDRSGNVLILFQRNNSLNINWSLRKKEKLFKYVKEPEIITVELIKTNT